MAASIINSEVPRFSSVSDLVRHILRDKYVIRRRSLPALPRAMADWPTGPALA